MLKTAIYGLAARHLRPHRHAALVVGRGGAGPRARHRALRRGVRRGAGGHEAPARLFVDREHRPHRDGPGPRDRLRAPTSMRSLAALALTAMLYHCLNHAIFKSLLFLGTGSVLHATHERSLGKLGGLMRYMPWVAWTTLVGVIACAGLPPLQRLRLRVAAAAELPLHRRAAQPLPQDAGADLRRGRRAGRGARGLRDGEVLRRDLPRPPARGAGSPRRARRRRPRAPRPRSGSPPAACCWASSRWR